MNKYKDRIPKYKVGDKLKINKRGLKNLSIDKHNNRADVGKVLEVKNAECLHGSPFYYITDAPGGDSGYWEVYVEKKNKCKLARE